MLISLSTTICTSDTGDVLPHDALISCLVELSELNMLMSFACFCRYNI